jgi:hypothetical protein
MAAGVAAALIWSLWRAAVESGRWRWPHLAVAFVSAVGAFNMATGRTFAEVAAGIALILAAPAFLYSYKGPGRLFAVVYLIWRMVLAIGTPRPWG